MKRALLIVICVFVLSTSFIVSAVETSNVEVGSMPTNLPEKYISSDYGIVVNNTNIPVYKAANNAWGNAVSYASFDFSGSVNVCVSVAFDFSTVRILPRNAGISCAVNGDKVNFMLSSPQNVTLVFDENFQGKTLHLFGQELETDAPSEDEENVIYFGPGYHDYSNQAPIMVPSNTIVYFAKGAVVMGRIVVADAENVTICGRGILLNDYVANDGQYDEVPLVIARSNDVTIEDIIISRDQVIWAAYMAKCQNVTVDSVKIINPRYSSSDGFDIANCQDVVYNNLFIRSCDDAISIKGTGARGYNTDEDPANGLANERITIQNCQIWSDTNNALEIGAETVAEYYRDIHFNNIDILYNYDNYEHPDFITYQSAINMCVLNATDISEIYFENIRVEKAKTLISVSCQDTYYFGGIIGNQDWSGSVHDIHYRNITSYSDGSNVIRMYGFDENHMIDDVEFENIVINGTPITSFDDERFKFNGFAQNLRIVSGETTLDEVDGPIGVAACSIAFGYGEEQGGNGWRYLAWNPDTGMEEMIWKDDTKCWGGPKYWDQIQKESDAVIMLPNSKQLLLEWNSAYEGVVGITGNVSKLQAGGDGVSVSIWKNDTMIWPENNTWQAIAQNDFVGYSHDITTTVSVGDRITFRVDQNVNESFDQVIWNPQIDISEADGPYEILETSASGDFSAIQEATGWRYQVLNDTSTWTDMTWSETEQRWSGLKTWDQLRRQGDYIILLPDSQQMRMEWTALSSGSVNLTGHVAKYQLDGGDGVFVSIWKNDVKVWPEGEEWKQIAYNDAVGYNYDFEIVVAAEDKISFRVDHNQNSASDQVMWCSDIRLVGESVPERQSVALSPVASFSSTQGENGWRYRALSNEVWSDMPVYSNDMWTGPLSWDQIHKVGSYIVMLPHSQQLMMEWTADRNGMARITGHVAKYQTDGGDGVSVSIWKNETKIWPSGNSWQQINYNDSIGVTHELFVAVANGDKISFRVDHNSNEACDQVAWNPNLIVTPVCIIEN